MMYNSFALQKWAVSMLSAKSKEEILSTYKRLFLFPEVKCIKINPSIFISCYSFDETTYKMKVNTFIIDHLPFKSAHALNKLVSSTSSFVIFM